MLTDEELRARMRALATDPVSDPAMRLPHVVAAGNRRRAHARLGVAAQTVAIAAMIAGAAWAVVANPAPVTPTSSNNSGTASCGAMTERGSVIESALSADGQTLAYVSEYPLFGPKSWILIVCRGGRVVARVPKGMSSQTWTSVENDRISTGQPEDRYRTFGVGADALSLSADGSLLVFDSFDARGLPGDPNDRKDVFLLDVSTGRIESITSTRRKLDSWGPAVSPNGDTIAFFSAERPATHDDIDTTTGFLFDRETGSVHRAAVPRNQRSSQFVKPVAGGFVWSSGLMTTGEGVRRVPGTNVSSNGRWFAEFNSPKGSSDGRRRASVILTDLMSGRKTTSVIPLVRGKVLVGEIGGVSDDGVRVVLSADIFTKNIMEQVTRNRAWLYDLSTRKLLPVTNAGLYAAPVAQTSDARTILIGALTASDHPYRHTHDLLMFDAKQGRLASVTWNPPIWIRFSYALSLLALIGLSTLAMALCLWMRGDGTSWEAVGMLAILLLFTAIPFAWVGVVRHPNPLPGLGAVAGADALLAIPVLARLRARMRQPVGT